MKFLILYFETKDIVCLVCLLFEHLDSIAADREYTVKCHINLISYKSFIENKSAEYIGKQFSTHIPLLNDHGVALMFLLNDVEICHLS